MRPGSSHFEKQRLDRREEFLTCSGKIFASKGYAATKISDIAAAAGVSQGLLYRYFTSKEGLFTELIRGSFEKLNQAADGLEKLHLPPKEKILRALGETIASMETSELFPNRVLLIAQTTLSEGIPEETKAIIQAESRKPYEAIARIMEAGQKDGSILAGDPTEMATLFWTTIKGLALHRVAQGTAFKAPDLKLVTRMFFAPSSDPPATRLPQEGGVA
jgi:TetR/AcrR family transcriptional regulator